MRERTGGKWLFDRVPRLLTVTTATLLAVSLLSIQAGPTEALVEANPYALLSVDGRQVTASGPISCADYPNNHPQYRVTMTQPSTGALAEQMWDRACTYDLQQSGWTVVLLDSRAAVFQEGDAELVVLDYDSTHQWINRVQLVSTLPAPTATATPAPPAP